MVTVVGTAGLVLTEYALSKRLPTVKAGSAGSAAQEQHSADLVRCSVCRRYVVVWPCSSNHAFYRRLCPQEHGPFAVLFRFDVHDAQHRHDAHQLPGRLSAEDAKVNLPYLLRSGGYVTGAFASNPFAYFLATDLQGGFDVLPEPSFRPGSFERFWNATRPVHQYSGVGSRAVEYFSIDDRWHLPGHIITDPSFA